jgi:hypothetical protein
MFGPPIHVKTKNVRYKTFSRQIHLLMVIQADEQNKASWMMCIQKS